MTLLILSHTLFPSFTFFLITPHTPSPFFPSLSLFPSLPSSLHLLSWQRVKNPLLFLLSLSLSLDLKGNVCEVVTRLQTFVLQTIWSSCFYIPIVSVIFFLFPGLCPTSPALYQYIYNCFDKLDLKAVTCTSQ